jgi:hypothetical protein
MYRTDVDAVVVVDVYDKKTRKIPDEVIDRCRKRLVEYDAIARRFANKPPRNPPRKSK